MYLINSGNSSKRARVNLLSRARLRSKQKQIFLTREFLRPIFENEEETEETRIFFREMAYHH